MLKKKIFDNIKSFFIFKKIISLLSRNKLLDVMKYNEPLTANEIMQRLGIKSKETLRATYIDPAIKEGVVALTIPDKPTSKNQMYYKK